MPLYDYVCAACGRRFEVIHGVHGDSPTSCPLCGEGPVRKAITAAAIHYKGSGWAKKERRTAVKTGTPSGGRDEGAADGGSSASEGGSSGEPGSISTDKEPGSPAAPAAAATGESSTGSPKSATSGRATKSPARDRD